MAIETKTIDLMEEGMSEQQWAEKTVGVWMNMLNSVYWNEVDNKYHFAPIKYSDVNLEGEKIKFGNGQELTVICSVLASEYANKQEVKEIWWNAAKQLKEDYLKQIQLDDHIKSHNTDLKKLRQEGQLLDDEK